MGRIEGLPVDALAARARIALREDEAEALRGDLEHLLAYVERLAEEPAPSSAAGGEGGLDADEPRPGLTVDEVAATAGDAFDAGERHFVCQSICRRVLPERP